MFPFKAGEKVSLVVLCKTEGTVTPEQPGVKFPFLYTPVFKLQQLVK